MQIKNNSSNTKKVIWLIARLMVSLVALYFIYDRFSSQDLALSDFKWPEKIEVIILVLSGLMLFNWSLEAVRWKVSLDIYEPVSFFKSLRIVLSGLAMNWVIPFTTGDAIVRLMPMRDKYRTTSAMMLNRTIMILITGCLGLYGVWMYKEGALNFTWFGSIILVVLLCLILLFRKRAKRFLAYFRDATTNHILKIASLSILRYSIFFIQFFIALAIFLPDIPAKYIIGGIGWIFLSRSVLPSLFGGIGIREASGILFFSSFVQDIRLVIVPVFFLWVINTVVPSVIGVFSLWKLKPYESSSS